MSQSPLFNSKVADAARDAAIDKAEIGADEAWLAAAAASIRYHAEHLKTFTTDEVWKLLSHLPEPREPRAMGAAMRNAQREEWIEATDRTKRSERPRCHRRPVRVWRSKLV